TPPPIGSLINSQNLLPIKHDSPNGGGSYKYSLPSLLAGTDTIIRVCSQNVFYYDTTSIPTISWLWHFGDGVGTSTLQNPTYTYANPGFYSALFLFWFTPTYNGFDFIEIEIPAKANFTSNIACGTASFTDLTITTPASPVTSWTWDFGDGSPYGTTQNPTHFYSPPGNYPVTLSVTAGGCTFVETKTITVVPYPIANFNAVPACAGSPAVFTDNSTGSTTTGWNWRFGDATSSGVKNPLHTYASGGNYSVSLTVSDANGCTSSITKTISIGSIAPNGSITTNGSLKFCYGSQVVLTAPTGLGYLWSNNATTQSISAIQSGVYSVAVTNTLGCTSSPPTVTVTVNPLPNNSFYPGPNKLCSGSTFYASVNSSSNYSYQWYNSGVAISTATLSSYNTTNLGNYSAIITDKTTGCKVPTGTVNVTAAPLPTPPVITGTNSFCDGAVVTLTATSSGGTGNLSYYWNNGTQGNTLQTSDAGTFYAYVQDENNCSNSASIKIKKNPAPNLSILPPGCIKNCGPYTLQGPPGYATYIWKDFNGNTIANTQNTLINSSGLYNLIVSTSFGCTDTSNNMDITINPFPSASAGNNKQICPGDSTQLQATAGPNIISYTWAPSSSLNNANIANPMATPASTTNYQLTVTDKNGCSAQASKTVTVFCIKPVVTANTIGVCSGTCASVTAIGSTGTPPYQYSWSTGTSGAILNVCPTTTTMYTVTITDTLGFTGTDTMMVIVNPNIQSITSSTNASCYSNNNGSASVSITVGGGAYSYSWSNGATTAVALNLNANTYSVTITDNNGCTGINTAIITEPNPLVGIIAPTHASCFGGTDGVATVAALGGTSPYSYSWTNNSITATASGLSLGTYSVSITDANGCSIVESISITEPTQISVSITTLSVSCNGTASGGATVASSTGGTPGYIYIWNNGTTTVNSTGLAAGNYSLTVIDSKGCTITQAITITQPSSIAINDNIVDVKCFNGTDGSITVTALGGLGNYSYTWSNGATTSAITNILSGIYSVTVADANNCSVSSTYTVNQPSQLTSTLTSSNINCFMANNGWASVIANGGTGNYTYLWSNNNQNATINSLAANNYSVTITDAKGCTNTHTVSITQPAVLAINTAISNVSCYAGNNGSLVPTVTGGTLGYNYFWSNGQTTSTLSNITFGAYSLTVTDANNCSTSINYSITQPTQLSASISYSNASCYQSNNGYTSVNASGGTGAYTYNWNTSSVSPTITGLSPNNYSVVISDANGCTITQTVTITEPTDIIVTANPSNISCFGGSNVNITTNTTGGTGSYTYNWSNGQQTANISNIIAGIYSLTLTDSNSCQKISTYTVNQPAALSATISTSNSLCYIANNGTASVNVSGGTAPYSYLWSNNGVTQSVSGLAPNNYSVTITDANGCTLIETTIITEPTAIADSTTFTNVSCNQGTDGAIFTKLTGGVIPYSYLWNNNQTIDTLLNLSAGGYTLTTTDANGCSLITNYVITEPTPLTSIITLTNNTCYLSNDAAIAATGVGGVGNYSYYWSNSDITSTIINLAQGIYTLTLSDNNNCTRIDTVTITEPTPITSAVTTTNVSCFAGTDGSASATASGGTGAHTFNWSNATQGTSTANLNAGNYSVLVTDIYGCSTTEYFTITEPLPINISVASFSVSCSGGSNGTALVASSSGGTPAYTYVWTNGSTTINTTGLAAGNYSLQVTDAKGCTYVQSVSISQPASIVLNNSQSEVSCFSGSDGSITVTALGGTGNYNYSWSNTETTSNITGLQAGSYTLTVSDNNSCNLVVSYLITQPTQLTSIITSSNSACNLLDNGTASVVAGGGTGAYTYSWSNNQQTSSVNSLSPATYTVVITDANACISTATVTITEPSAITLSVTSIQKSCQNATNGSISVIAGGGTPGYSYLWNNLVASSSIGNITAGTYTILVTDNNGCTFDTAYTVVSVAKPTATFAISDSAGCGIVCTTLKNTTANTTSAWSMSNGATSTNDTINICFTDTGLFSIQLIVTDTNGCVDSLIKQNSIVVHPIPVADYSVTPQPTTIVNSSILFTNLSSNATSYFWNFGDNSPFQTGVNPLYTYDDTGRYETTLIAENMFGCRDTANKTVIIGADFVFYIPNAFTPNGDDKNNLFFPVVIGAVKFEMWIYDRWGLQIWHSTDPKQGWNGKRDGHDNPVQQDVYVWLIKITDEFGIKHKHIGHVSVIR
ncbi:MAG: PKD domain-containing protein, partial [Bacteroidetes bacterium]|nr:PKD domain-containing protein [Bacteroidota bacterium]